MAEWKKTGPHNWELQGDGFRISYLDDTAAVFESSFLSRLFNGDAKDETAIVIPNGDGTNSYYILNGDWRDAYTPLVEQGFDACLAFYHQKRLEGAGSTWSSDDPAMPQSMKDTLLEMGADEEMIESLAKELEEGGITK